MYKEKSCRILEFFALLSSIPVNDKVDCHRIVSSNIVTDDHRNGKIVQCQENISLIESQRFLQNPSKDLSQEKKEKYCSDNELKILRFDLIFNRVLLDLYFYLKENITRICVKLNYF